jgi:hypothetical protein
VALNLDLVALMIDGVHFGEYLCVVALGIGIDGTKHPLGLGEGSTENTTVVAFRPIVSDDDHRQPPNASRSDRSGSSRRQSRPNDECSTMDPISARSARHPISDSTTAVEEGAVIQ